MILLDETFGAVSKAWNIHPKTNSPTKNTTHSNIWVAVTPMVEDIQDVVESTLIGSDNSDIAKAYIVYRHGYNIWLELLESLSIKISF